MEVHKKSTTLCFSYVSLVRNMMVFVELSLENCQLEQVSKAPSFKRGEPKPKLKKSGP